MYVFSLRLLHTLPSSCAMRRLKYGGPVVAFTYSAGYFTTTGSGFIGTGYFVTYQKAGVCIALSSLTEENISTITPKAVCATIRFAPLPWGYFSCLYPACTALILFDGNYDANPPRRTDWPPVYFLRYSTPTRRLRHRFRPPEFFH